MIIENDVINELIINKSRFVTYIYKVKDLSSFLNYLENIKKEYQDATHICYAYIIDNKIKYNDDNEPLGTAGIPILEVLKRNNLNYVGAIVIRYFGGIKLGSGGLTRAYSNSISLALKKTKIKKLEQLKKIQLTLTYKKLKLIENFIDEKKIIEKNYTDKITYIILINDDLQSKLDSYNLDYKILDDNYF